MSINTQTLHRIRIEYVHQFSMYVLYNHKFTSASLMKKTISEKDVKTFRAINCTCSSYCSIAKSTLQCRSKACYCDKCYKENIQKPPCRRISVQFPFYGLFPSTFSLIVLHFPFFLRIKFFYLHSIYSDKTDEQIQYAHNATNCKR